MLGLALLWIRLLWIRLLWIRLLWISAAPSQRHLRLGPLQLESLRPNISAERAAAARGPCSLGIVFECARKSHATRA